MVYLKLLHDVFCSVHEFFFLVTLSFKKKNEIQVQRVSKNHQKINQKTHLSPPPPNFPIVLRGYTRERCRAEEEQSLWPESSFFSNYGGRMTSFVLSLQGMQSARALWRFAVPDHNVALLSPGLSMQLSFVFMHLQETQE